VGEVVQQAAVRLHPAQWCRLGTVHPCGPIS
jgi:hypothetical protein